MLNHPFGCLDHKMLIKKLKFTCPINCKSCVEHLSKGNVARILSSPEKFDWLKVVWSFVHLATLYVNPTGKFWTANIKCLELFQFPLKYISNCCPLVPKEWNEVFSGEERKLKSKFTLNFNPSVSLYEKWKVKYDNHISMINTYQCKFNNKI